MVLLVAAVAAMLLSVIASLIAGVGLSFAFSLPLIVAAPLLGVAYVWLWLVIPLCLIVNLMAAAPSRRDWPIHVVALLLLPAIWWFWNAILPNHNPGERNLWLVSFAPVAATVPAQWLAFLLGQRRRRRPIPSQPAITP